MPTKDAERGSSLIKHIIKEVSRDRDKVTEVTNEMYSKVVVMFHSLLQLVVVTFHSLRQLVVVTFHTLL